MTKGKKLGVSIAFLSVAVIIPMIMVGIARSQETSFTVGVVNGSLSEHTLFSSVANVDNVAFYKSSYQSEFRTTQANTSFDKTFNETGVTTNVTGVSNMYINEKEVIGATQIYDQSCVAAAAGSKFVGSAIEYNGIASPGGVGDCAGVGFIGDVPQSVGRLSFASIYRRIGEVTIEPEEEGGTATTTFENTLQKTEVTIDGTQNNTTFMVIPVQCNPADAPTKEPFYKFELCADPPTGLLPWPNANVLP